MRIAIITTTIGTAEGLLPFVRAAQSSALDWGMYIVGDRKTPDLSAFASGAGPRVHWVPASDQDRWGTSKVLRWNCIQRRNIGFLAAAADGPWDFYLSVDDDNEPMPGYFQAFERRATEPVGQVVDADGEWFNYFQGAEVEPPVVPFARGFPITKRGDARWNSSPAEIEAEQVWAYQGLSTGDPDVDASTHIVARPAVARFAEASVVSRGAWSPINSQNTFVRSHCLPLYLMFDQVGRFDDIVAGFILQHYIYENGGHVHFGEPFTHQRRGERDWLQDFSQEVEGALTIDAIVEHIRSVDVRGVSPTEAMRRTFRDQQGAPEFFSRHVPLVEAWLADLAEAGY